MFHMRADGGEVIGADGIFAKPSIGCGAFFRRVAQQGTLGREEKLFDEIDINNFNHQVIEF